MQAARREVKQPTGGWLRAVRQACGFSSLAVAKKLGITRQAYSQLEGREAAGTASMEQLSRGAAALDCDLVYFLVPKSGVGVNFGALAVRNDVELARFLASEHSMVLEGQQTATDIDSRNIGLAKQIYWLRQNLSLYELLAVNAGKLKETGASEALFAHIQALALDAVGTTLGRIFRRDSPDDVNSIEGVVRTLAETGHTDAQRRSAERFAERHGIVRPCRDPKTYLMEVLSAFIAGHQDVFSSLARHRRVLPMAHGFEAHDLPSFEDFATLYQFAYEFYFLIADTFLDIGPALMTLHVGSGLIRLLKQLGIAHPAPGFPTAADER
jgi:predicted DNA-binding mobile mystery protein A